jgi:hypothetical protein
MVEKRLLRVIFDIATKKTAVTIPGLLAEALTDISAIGIHGICNADANWFTAGETFFYYVRTDFNSISQISEY